MKFSSYKLNLLLSSTFDDSNSSKSLRSIASDIGISAGYLALLRNGSKTNPGPSTISKLSRYFHVEPTEFFEDELGFASNSYLSLKVTFELCDELIATDRADKAMEVLNRLIAHQAQVLKEANLFDSAVLLRAVAMSRLGNSEESLLVLDNFLQQELADSIRCLGFYERSRVYYRTGYFEKAIEDAKRAVDLLQQAEIAESNSRLLRKCHYAMGIYYGRISRYALSVLHYDRARALVDNAEDRETANILAGLGHTYVLMNEPAMAEQYLLLAKEIYETHHDTQATSNIYHNLSRCKFLQGNYAAASQLLLQSLELHQQIESMKGVAYDYLELARNSFRTRDYALAKELSTRSYVTFDAIKDDGQAARARLLRIESMLCSGDHWDGVLPELESIIEYFHTHHWLKELAKAERIQATILEMNGKQEEANKIYKRLVTDYESYLDEMMFTD